MTIITVRDVETNEVIIIRSVIDPIAKLDKNGEVQIFRNKSGSLTNRVISYQKSFMEHLRAEKLECM